MTFDQNTDFIWNLENKGILKSVKLNGEIQNTGTVKIYLEHEDISYLIFDNKRLKEKGIEEITAFVIKRLELEVETEGIFSTEEKAILDALIANINTSKNNVEIEIEMDDNEINKKIDGILSDGQNLLIDTLMTFLKDNENFKIRIISDFEGIDLPKETINETILNQTLIDETLPLNETNLTTPINGTINVTPISNETIEDIPISKIDIILEYRSDSVYDINDDGIENIESAIDLTVSFTKFNFDVKEENLCSRWDTYSVDNDQSTVVCYGSSNCCNFVDLISIRTSWHEPYYTSYGQYGSTLNNIISAQVIYVDFNLSLENPYSEIYYSDWKNLSADFYQGFTGFENICIGTCILPNLNSSNYNLKFEIENSSINLESISYQLLVDEKINNPPILLNNFSDITIFEDEFFSINMSNYFYDPDNDTLIFTFYNESGLDVNIINEISILKANNFTGIAYMFFTADDSFDTLTSNVFEVKIKKRNKIYGVFKSLRQIIGLG